LTNYDFGENKNNINGSWTRRCVSAPFLTMNR